MKLTFEFRLDDKLGLSHIRGLGERGHYWQNLFDHRDSYPVQATVFYDLVNTLASVFVKSMSGDMVLDKVSLKAACHCPDY